MIKVILAVFLANAGDVSSVIMFDKEMESIAACERTVEMVQEKYSLQYDYIKASCFKYSLTEV